MSVRAGLRRRRAGAVSSAVLSIVALVITGLAIRFDGLHSSEVKVSDGTVWVTNSSEGELGRLNVDAQELNTRVQTVAENLDVMQSGYNVLQTSANGFVSVDSAYEKGGPLVQLVQGGVVKLGGDRVAIAYPDGRVWVMTAKEAAGFDPSAHEPNFEGRAPLINVTTTGAVHILDERTLYVLDYTLDPRDASSDDGHEIAGLANSNDALSLTSVGEEPVIMDRENRQIRLGTDGRAVDLADEGVTDLSTAQLQLPSAASDHVVLATTDRLFEIPFGRGAIRSSGAGGTGTPVAPAQAVNCSYGSWMGARTYVKMCNGEETTGAPIAGAKESSDLILRQNRDLVVLNDQQFGLVWLISDDMQLVDKWEIQQKIETDKTEKKEKESYTSTITNIAADRDEENRDPIAEDDEFGVRPGASVVLPVTRNDTDPDGDVLTATVKGDQPDIGTVTPIRGGTQLQIVVDESVSGTAEFTYEVSDGRGGRDTATVSLEVVPDTENREPEQADTHTPKVLVRSGEEVSFNILPYWQDPDGDAFYLVNATAEPDDVVTFRPDGLITFTDAGTATGEKTVSLTFRDEQGAQAEGELKVESTSEADLAPVTTADHIRVVTHRSATIKPLVNDLNPNGGKLELTHVGEARGLEVDAALEAGTVNVTGTSPGTFYLPYTVASSNGSQSSPGLIRVDIVEAQAENLVPVAVDDMGMVITGTDTLIDPLENDVDPTGGVLVVNSVEVPQDSGLKATVVGHHLIRVEAEPGAEVPDRPVPLTYEVANAAGSAVGTARIMLVSTDTQFATPIAVPDSAVVRAGDMVTVDVLANDVSPTNSTLRLGRITPVGGTEELGHSEPNQDRVRFSADDDASGEATIEYEVIDATGRTASARLNIRVVPRDAENNPPRPVNLEGRTVAGTPVRIPVPTTGVDPDGDSVMLMGITSPHPLKGEVAKATGEWIEYVPHEDEVGTDRFTYQVMDRDGAIGTAEVLVGIAKPNTANQAPYAVDDTIEVKPDREVEIPVLENDIDPEGAPLSIVPEDVEVLGEDGLTLVDSPETAGTLVTARTPTEPGTYAATYAVTDGQLKSTATITVKVDENATELNPIARDDFIEAADVLDPEAEYVEVDVLANDSDPDGSVNDLEVTLDDAPEGVELLEDGRTVRLAPPDELTRFRYIIEDPDQKTSAGYVWVPGRSKQDPVWVGGTIEVQSGQEVRIDISSADNVRVRPGAEPARITEVEKVSAEHGAGGQLVMDESTISYRSAEGYDGPDTIQVEVADGEVGAPTTAVASIAIPVIVNHEEENLPPTFLGAELNVEQGGDAASVDLAAGAEDPDGDELTFALGEGFEAPDGMTVSVEGSSLQAQAAADVQKGTRATVPVTVTDGANDPVPAEVTLTVTGSMKPKVSAVLDTAVIDAGTSETLDVLANDSNPFPGQELTLLDAVKVSGEGTVTKDGNQVTISPDADFHGILTATYRVQDMTEDPDRVVTGEIRVEVRGKPDAPTAPRIGDESDSAVELQFTPGNDNGAPITGYRVVSASGPAVEQNCSSTSCTVTGLRNGEEYTFRVIAINDVGESEPSPVSATARPDVRPEAPPAPTAARGDTRLDVTWGAPVNRGSAIQKYELQIRDGSTGAVASKTIEGDVRSDTWTELTNGVDYSFRVRAYNLSEEPSDWSPWSAPEHPAGRPGKPSGRVTADRVNNELGGGVTVTWPAMSAEEANGEPITEYVVTASSGDTMTIPATDLRATFRGLDQDTSHTFTVTGVNSVGRGTAASDASNTVTPWAVPDRPRNVRATMPSEGTGEGPNGRATVTWDAADGRGTTVDHYIVRWNGGSRKETGTSLNLTGLTNGTAYTFTVQAVNRFESEGGVSAFSDPSKAVTPYTVPDAPAVQITAGECRGATDCDMKVTANASGSDGGNGPKTLNVWIDGNKQSVFGTTFSTTIKVDSASRHTVEAEVTNGGGLSSGRRSASANAKTYVPPPPKISPQWGAHKKRAGVCGSDFCREIDFRVSGLDPNKTYTMTMTTLPSPVHPGGDWGYNIKVTPRADGTYSTRHDGGYDFLYGYPQNTVVVYIDKKEVSRFTMP